MLRLFGMAMIWKTVMTEIYDKKGVQEKTFPEYDGIVRKAYDPGNGLLARYSSGSYGWYDVNNLPAYSSSSGTTRARDNEDNENNEDSEKTTAAEKQTAANSDEE